MHETLATGAAVPATCGLFDDELRSRLADAHSAAMAALIRERNSAGWWTGELSSSALSTATAVTALTLYSRGVAAEAARLRELIQRGYEWLGKNQNADGGWGDTKRSISNISTTTLVWAAFGLHPTSDAATMSAITAAEEWLSRAAGSLEPRDLVRAIEGRYGQDRTFSIPILTLAALCGRLGKGRDGWRHVRQLPFELAALPQRWFAALQLPVVSYALPALIAIGQVRHGLRPTRNPLFRVIRDRCRARTLEKLGRLQPENGGFLEAAPLTSFVTMSLAALGLYEHSVVQRGVAFLEASARPDGSWPIDTNLATWVTTLSVNALEPVAASASEPTAGHSLTLVATAHESSALSSADRAAIRDWLLRQQGRTEHPYTLAAPGGWAWTDLPGGVPDADDTAGALLALHRLGANDPQVRSAADAGVGWLLGLQNRDGGIPTFCRGWGKLPFDRSSPDLTAHAIRAWLVWCEFLPEPRQRALASALARAARFLCANRRADGAWVPLWFGHEEDSADENPLYGTARVLPALGELELAGHRKVTAALDRAQQWLVARQNSDGGWSGARGAKSSVEESGVALEALASAWRRTSMTGEHRAALRVAIERGARWLVTAMESGQWRNSSPIGLYFAKLWYHERLYPLIFATAALQRLNKIR
ncbi:MAG: prenyltransferase/squalene oxidase repeat-containing protein [Opitutaceae bacterium]|nr:prenyltransferase/squalene oxidase repeat-containing protein [Opitutaceae bacterium]